ncbi:MAG: CDP-alcohol phosphatidyltransferase family protein [Balneolaceae bacterium]
MTKHNLTNIDGRKISVKDDIFTWSNLLSLSRLLVAFPIIYLHMQNNYQVNILIVILISLGIFSDYLDGLVARKRNEVSELGKALDPVADKMMAVVLFGYTVWLGWIPVWYFALGVVRDLLIVAGSAYIKWLRGKVAMAVMSGKISVNVMALYWVSVFFFPEATQAHQFFMISSVILMVVSFIHYCYRFDQIRKGAEYN